MNRNTERLIDEILDEVLSKPVKKPPTEKEIKERYPLQYRFCEVLVWLERKTQWVWLYRWYRKIWVKIRLGEDGK